MIARARAWWRNRQLRRRISRDLALAAAVATVLDASPDMRRAFRRALRAKGYEK